MYPYRSRESHRDAFLLMLLRLERLFRARGELVRQLLQLGFRWYRRPEKEQEGERGRGRRLGENQIENHIMKSKTESKIK